MLPVKIILLAAITAICGASRGHAPTFLQGIKIPGTCKMAAIPARDLSHLNSAFCTFSPMFRCTETDRHIDDLTCTNAGPEHIRDVLRAYAYQAHSARNRINVNLLWATYQTDMEKTLYRLDGDVIDQQVGELIQTLYVYLDTPSSILEPSFFTNLPNLVILQVEFLHKVKKDFTSTLNNFAGYFRLPSLEFIFLNVGNEQFTIDRDTVVNMPRLKCFKLVGIRFHCDCPLQSFLRDLRSQTPSPIDGTYTNPSVAPFMSYFCDANYAYCDTAPNQVIEEAPDVLGIPIVELDLPQCIDPQEPAYPVTLRVTCDANNLHLQLDGSVPFYRYSMKGFYGQNAPMCQGSADAQALSGRFGQCGVTSVEDNGERYLECVAVVDIKSDVIVDYLISHPVVQPADQSAYRIRCKEGATQQTAMSRGTVQRHTAGKGQHTVILRVPTDNFAVGRYTFDILAVDTDSSEWDIRVESCYATPTNNPQDTLRYHLVRDGCFADPSTDMQFLQTPTNFGYRYSFTPFRFRGRETGESFVHCTVGLCQASAPDFSQCMSGHTSDHCPEAAAMRKGSRKWPGRVSVLSAPLANATVSRSKRSIILDNNDSVSVIIQHTGLQAGSLLVQ